MAKMWVYNAALNKWQSLGGGDVTGADHGVLSGLGDDDHPQYLTNARGDARYSLAGHNHGQTYLTPTSVKAGANITIVNHGDGTITISSTGGGGGGTGVDEVQISTNSPTDPSVEMWIDTDAQATFRAVDQQAAVATDHGLLTGLGDDDHPQYVLNTGDTLTGGLILTGSAGLRHKPLSGSAAAVSVESVGGTAYFDTSASSGKNQGLLLRTGNDARWVIGSDALPEGVGNSGTNLSIARFSDSGQSLGTALTINRATGLITVAADPSSALGVATKQYADAKVANAVGTSTTVAPSQKAIKDYVDSQMIVSDNPANGVYPADTVWVEY